MAHTAEYRREYYRKNREKVLAYNKKWRAKNPERAAEYYREYSRQYRTTPQGKAARVKAQRKYLTGFTDDLWTKRLAEQGGLCAICREDAATAADHNHANNEPRGILCSRCNSALGLFLESPKRLEGAIAYLHKWNTNG